MDIIYYLFKSLYIVERCLSSFGDNKTIQSKDAKDESNNYMLFVLPYEQVSQPAVIYIWRTILSCIREKILHKINILIFQYHSIR